MTHVGETFSNLFTPLCIQDFNQKAIKVQFLFSMKQRYSEDLGIYKNATIKGSLYVCLFKNLG